MRHSIVQWQEWPTAGISTMQKATRVIMGHGSFVQHELLWDQGHVTSQPLWEGLTQCSYSVKWAGERHCLLSIDTHLVKQGDLMSPKKNSLLGNLPSISSTSICHGRWAGSFLETLTFAFKSPRGKCNGTDTPSPRKKQNPPSLCKMPTGQDLVGSLWLRAREGWSWLYLPT